MMSLDNIPTIVSNRCLIYVSYLSCIVHKLQAFSIVRNGGLRSRAPGLCRPKVTLPVGSAPFTVNVQRAHFLSSMRQSVLSIMAECRFRPPEPI
jgi:hypothetical protein